jgi:hypothetical protein
VLPAYSTASHDLHQIVAPPRRRSTQGPSSGAWSPLQNLFVLTANGSARNVSCPLSLQLSNPLSYLVYMVWLWFSLLLIRSCGNRYSKEWGNSLHSILLQLLLLHLLRRHLLSKNFCQKMCFITGIRRSSWNAWGKVMVGIKRS